MTDYREMYLTLFNAVTDAVAILIKTQKKMEALYVQTSEDPAGALVDDVRDPAEI